MNNSGGLSFQKTAISRKPPANLRPEDAWLFDDSFNYATLGEPAQFFKHCYVTKDSVVYIGTKLLPESLPDPAYLTYYRIRYLAKNWLRSKRRILKQGPRYLLATDLYSTGHYHWFCEVLPKLFRLGARSEEFILMLPDDPYVRSISIESLELLGLKFADICWMNDGEFYDVKGLCFLPRIAASGQVDDVVMRRLNHALVDATVPAHRRIYISRAKAQRRKILNEGEFLDLLHRYRFEVIHAEGLALRQQVEIFRECDTLIGLHGAGLTNCLFMPAGGKVVELRKREPNYAYWHLADSVGHRYYYYHGVPDSDSSLIGEGCNLTIDVDDFENRILAVLAE